MSEPPVEMRVRPAKIEDANAMGAVHVAAWQVGYDGILPPELLDGLTVERSAGMWRTALASDDRPSTSLVAEVDRQLLGICSFGPYRTVDGQETPPDTSELWMLNAHPDAWGTGMAQALIDAAVDGLRLDYPASAAALWVLDANARGRRFYEKEGWSPDGGTKVDTFAGQDLIEVRYRRTL